MGGAPKYMVQLEVEEEEHDHIASTFLDPSLSCDTLDRELRESTPQPAAAGDAIIPDTGRRWQATQVVTIWHTRRARHSS